MPEPRSAKPATGAASGSGARCGHAPGVGENHQMTLED
jgi:hypothetical protein